jgi:hypothetical protein
VDIDKLRDIIQKRLPDMDETLEHYRGRVKTGKTKQSTLDYYRGFYDCYKEIIWLTEEDKHYQWHLMSLEYYNKTHLAGRFADDNKWMLLFGRFNPEKPEWFDVSKTLFFVTKEEAMEYVKKHYSHLDVVKKKIHDQTV